MVAGLPSLKSDCGRDMQGTLFCLAFETDWGERMLWFSLSLNLLGLAFSLSRERLGWCSPLTPTDSEPLAAVWEPKKGSGRNGSKQIKKIRIRWEWQISFFKKENKLSKDCSSKDNVSNALSPLV